MTVTLYKKIWENGAKDEKVPYSPHMELCDDSDVVCYHNVDMIDGTSEFFWLGFYKDGELSYIKFYLKYWTISNVTEI